MPGLNLSGANGFFAPDSIKSKFFRIVLPPVCIGFLLISLISGFMSYFDMQNQIVIRAQRNAESYSKTLGMSLWNLNLTVIEAQIQTILNNPDISGVRLVESLGGQEFSAGEVPEGDFPGSYIVSSCDVMYTAFEEPESLGILTVYVKKDRIYTTLVKRFLRDALLFFILIVIVITAVLNANEKIIIEPLKRLLESIWRFEQHNEVKPVEWTTHDEIGQVITAYNGLVVSLDMSNTQLRGALEKARDANKIKGEFLANMSHEIRTPLNGIMGMADLLNHTPLTTDQQNLSATIQTESESLLGIINDILDFSKIEAGKLELEQINFNLRHTMENLCATMAVNAQRKNVELVHFLEPDAVINLIGDPGRLRQIFVNLIGNAIKFTHEGEVFVKGEMKEIFEQKAVFLFSVTDTGIGIPKQKQETIFESFSQGDGSTTRKYGGTGLGITIAKMLVEKMGGRIGLSSEPGKGTCFWFEVEFFRQPEDGSEISVATAEFDNVNALIIDDVKSNRDVLCSYLGDWGANTMTSEDAEDTLRVLKQSAGTGRKIDVILIDDSMPSMNDFSLAKLIRRLPEYKDTPLVLLAGIGRMGDGMACKKIGIDGYLTKPVRQEDLRAFLNFVMGRSSSIDPVNKKLITRHTIAEIRRENAVILLVEDYKTNQELAMRQLESVGFKSVLAADGREAVELFKKQKFDLILMDIQMPVMDGYEATRKIRDIETGQSRVPIVAMTAHAMKGYKEECLKAGMDDYITKPLKREHLISTVTKWIHTAPEMLPSKNYYIRRKTGQDTGTPSLIDFNRAMAEFDHDAAFLADVIKEFVGVAGKQISQISAALKEKNTKIIAEHAHSIKGGAANLCANRLSGIASDLEVKAKAMDLERAAITVEKLSEELNELSRWLDGHWISQVSEEATLTPESFS